MVRAAKLAGAQAFVTKSDVSSNLLKAVDAVLEGHTFFSNGNTTATAPVPGTTARH
jgi:DNA-binding NarL/FixJ family response regulator